jgi:hypothetical protein
VAAVDSLRAQYALQQSTVRQQEVDLAAKKGPRHTWRKPTMGRAKTSSVRLRFTKRRSQPSSLFRPGSRQHASS